MFGANTDVARCTGLRTPRWRARLLEALRARTDAKGLVVLEFEIVYGHAFKAAPRARVAAHTEVGLSRHALDAPARARARAGVEIAQARILRSLLAVPAHNTLCKPCKGGLQLALIMQPTRAIRWFPDPTKDR